MSKSVRDWAAKGGPLVDLNRLRQKPAPTGPLVRESRPEPTPAPSPARNPIVHVAAPEARPAGQIVIVGADPRRTVAASGPTYASCFLVRPDSERGDLAAQALAELPDLSGGHDMSQGYDAMRMAGAPQGGAMAHWTSGARYYNGVSDMTAEGNLGTHIRTAHQADLATIRTPLRNR